MEREVVVPGAEVDVLRVRTPHHSHVEVLPVERRRGADVAHAKRHVPEPANAARRLGHHALVLAAPAAGNSWTAQAGTAAASTSRTLAAPGRAATAAASRSTCGSASVRRARPRNFAPSAAASG